MSTVEPEDLTPEEWQEMDRFIDGKIQSIDATIVTKMEKYYDLKCQHYPAEFMRQQDRKIAALTLRIKELETNGNN